MLGFQRTCGQDSKEAMENSSLLPGLHQQMARALRKKGLKFEAGGSADLRTAQIVYIQRVLQADLTYNDWLKNLGDAWPACHLLTCTCQTRA